MSEKQVVLVTGAGRGMGVDIARAALAAGHRVVATARDAERVVQALGSSADLLAVSLDITDPASTQAAVTAAVDRFGRLEVLINNAGNFYAGFFEEITPDAFRAQVETNLFGPLTVTRAVLPVMRAQRSGIVVTISSTAGLIGGEFASAYAASRPRSRISWNPSHPGTSEEPPVRRVAGADAVAGVEQKAKDLQAQVDAHRELSSSLSHDAD